MGKIMDFIKGSKVKGNELSEPSNKYYLYDTYTTNHHAVTYAKKMDRMGKYTKIIEKGDGWQLWIRD